MGYLVGGHDTTSTTIAWFTKFIAASQTSQSRLREALHAAHKDAFAAQRPPTIEEITHTHIPYLDAVTEETLRMARTLPILLRRSTCDTTIMGHAIPKGTTLLIITHGPSFLTPSIPVEEGSRGHSGNSAKSRYGEWDDENVEAFMPERWLKLEDIEGEKKEVFDPMAGPMLAFGGGPRGCFGRKLAYMELKVTITLMVWAFEFGVLPNGMDDMVAVDRMTSVPRQCHVRLKRI